MHIFRSSHFQKWNPIAMFSWFRKYIPNYNAVAERSTRLLKNNTLFVWAFEQETALKKSNDIIVEF